MAPRASYFRGTLTIEDKDAGYKAVLTERERYSLEADMLEQLHLDRRVGRHKGGTTVDTDPGGASSSRRD